MNTLRLDSKLERDINNLAAQMGVSKSQLIRESIAKYIAIHKNQSAWELGNTYFGKYTSAQGNLSTDRKSLVKNKIKVKR